MIDYVVVSAGKKDDKSVNENVNKEILSPHLIL